jgi:hypothetical protein
LLRQIIEILKNRDKFFNKKAALNTMVNPNQNGVPKLLMKNGVELIWPHSISFPSQSVSRKLGH